MSAEDRQLRSLPERRYDLFVGVTTDGYYAKITNGLHFATGTAGSPVRATKRAVSKFHGVFAEDLSQVPGGPQ